jgi:hypothetical protein
MGGVLQAHRVDTISDADYFANSTISRMSLSPLIFLGFCPCQESVNPVCAECSHFSGPTPTLVNLPAFMIDAATIKQELNSVANTVYSTLLALPRPVHVLFVTNKSDLLTELPVHKVPELLEEEISTLKKTRTSGQSSEDRL